MKPVLRFYDFAGGVRAFTTTRHGGYSKGNYSQLNINPHRGDDPEAVERNLRAVADELSLDAGHIIRQHQVHKTSIRNITSEYFSLPYDDRKRYMEGIDAVVTAESRTCVGVFTADCIPVLFYDTVSQAIGAAHAGWRGTVQRIAQKTVAYMRECFGSEPCNIHALIGPGITLRNFEVGQEVYDEFEKACFDMPLISRKFPANGVSGGEHSWKWHIDLPQCNRLQLVESGLLPENIVMTGIDTYDNCSEYFSARRLKTGFGTMYTGIFKP